LYLRKSSQNQGLGVALLNFAKRESQGKLALWVLAQNHAARRFYIREGFTETGHGDGADNEENLPDIRYEWCREVNKIG
jgi:GNAT superfamily N-acetyltransferase